MISEILTYDKLGITHADIYEQIGYGEAAADDDVQREVTEVEKLIKAALRPEYCFFITKGELNATDNTLSAMGNTFTAGRIICRQLRGSAAFAFFIATAGKAFEELQQSLKREGDMVKIFIADAIGSVIAEKTADRMEERLQACINPYDWRHTNRFSPGYCGWHVSQQQMLFKMFGVEEPCGVTLTPSSLMMPIKSVSGVIGVGPEVRKLEYSCGLCDLKDCYKRRKRQP